MRDRMHVGFIGAGRIADLHALGYDGNADAKLYAVCDADGEWAARRAQEWGAERSFTDYRELLGASCSLGVRMWAISILRPPDRSTSMERPQSFGRSWPFVPSAEVPLSA